MLRRFKWLDYDRNDFLKKFINEPIMDKDSGTHLESEAFDFQMRLREQARD